MLQRFVIALALFGCVVSASNGVDMTTHPIWSRWVKQRAGMIPETNITEVSKGYPAHVYGVDVSQVTGGGAFSCLNSNNLTFAVVRCWRSTGSADPNCPVTINGAWQGGLAHVDAYIFPCYPCGNPSGQITEAVQFLKNNGVRYGMIWLDIETYAWSSNKASNQQFFASMLSTAVNLGQNVGIYTNYNNWGSIMGLDYTGGSGHPVWYAHYDGNPSFSDWVPFGGWKTPAIKQFSDAGNKCNANYDINWYPA